MGQAAFPMPAVLFILTKKIKTYCNSRNCSTFGTPGETRTHYIPLRRRALYPGEVRGQLFIFHIRYDTGDDALHPVTVAVYLLFYSRGRSLVKIGCPAPQVFKKKKRDATLK